MSRRLLRKEGRTIEQMARNWSRGWLIPFLLLRVRDGNARGRELMRMVLGSGFDALRPAAVYRALRQMEREGMIVSEPAASGETQEAPSVLWPPRRRYEITETGEAYLAFWADALEQYREEMNLFLKLYAEHSARERA